MRFEFKPAFDRSIRGFSTNEKDEIEKIIDHLIGILSQNRFLQRGMGLKRLRGDYWEVRYGLKARILFRWKNDLVEFVLVGNHDDIKKFLKNV